MSHLLDPLFKPKVIAVIGAADDPSSIGGIIVRNIIESGFTGKLVPVNRTGATVHSLKVVKDISKISGTVDLAVITDGNIPDAINSCQTKGVKALIVAAGSGESIPTKNTTGTGPIILGPNSAGVVAGLNVSVLPGLGLAGHVALIDQSGTSAQTLITEAEQIGLGFSLVASIGDSPNISITDLLEYCEDDPNTKLILLHVVSSCQSRNFAQLCRRISRKKPIVLLQPGSFALVRRTISCGEGSTKDYDLDISYLYSQCGVHIARTITGLLAIARVLVSSPVPDGNRVGIIGNQGGPTELLINACSAHGLVVNRSGSNPIILSAVPSTNELKAALAKEHSNHDLLVIAIVPPPGLETSETIDDLTTLVSEIDKPVIGVLGSQAVSVSRKGKKKKSAIPLFRFPETAAIAMAALNRRRAWLGRDVGKIVSYAVTSEIAQSVIDGVIAESRRDLTLPETLMVLDAYGINVPRYSYAKDLEEALSAAHGLSYPVSMQLLSKDLANKKEVGGVFAHVKNADDLTSNFLTLVSRAQRHQLSLDGILIQEVIKGDDSISFGVFDDTEFGTLVIFGQEERSGSFARNIRMKPWPLTDVDAADIARSFSAKIDAGSDNDDDNRSYELIEETLLRLSQLVKDFDSIGEIIINRFVVFPDHEESKAVDAQIKLK